MKVIVEETELIRSYKFEFRENHSPIAQVHRITNHWKIFARETVFYDFSEYRASMWYSLPKRSQPQFEQTTTKRTLAVIVIIIFRKIIWN